MALSSDLKVLIAVSTAEIARQAVFYDYVDILEKPEGTKLTRCHGQSPAASRNLMIKQALGHDCTHVFFLDDDVILKSDALMKLLEHDVDIVSGLYLMRNYPHRPICFGLANSDGSCLHKVLADDDLGLHEVVAAGLGCLLIKTEVFKTMKYPWITMGELDPENWCDDLSFCKRARDNGYKIHVDLNVPVGHMATVTIWPNRHENKWIVSYDTLGAGQVSFPMVQDGK